MEPSDVMTWLTENVSPDVFMLITVGTLFLVRTARAVCGRIPRFPKDFNDWWILAGLTGMAFSLALVEPSLRGAIVGLAAGASAIAGYEAWTRGGVILKGSSPAG